MEKRLALANARVIGIGAAGILLAFVASHWVLEAADKYFGR